MLKSTRLKPVIKIAQNREDDAALALNEYRKVIDQQEARMIELRQYHTEYTQRLNDSGRNGLNIAQINDYRHFIARLAVAVKQQEEQLASCEAQLKEKHDAWMLTRVRHQALDKVVDRYQQQEHQASEKREQFESDERSQHMGRNKRPE
ncbi:MAG: flagellar export protein FliJ [Gammaproteobacteria bacterium]|nr:flagellar export protein FliJ [Gammaproteobacteria bacterium]